MGCDIHPFVETKINGKWKVVWWHNPLYKRFQDWDEPEKTIKWYELSSRNYNAFAVLADVRNGSGFAGADTGDGFNYIQKNRGIPKDVDPEALKEIKEGPSRFYIGEHSFGWVSLKELLEFDWAQTTKCRGWVNGPEYYSFDTYTRVYDPLQGPDKYVTSIGGGLVSHCSEEDMKKNIQTAINAAKISNLSIKEYLENYENTYCPIEWEEIYSESVGKLYSRCIPLLRRLIPPGGGPEDVRVVFGFDS